MTKYYKSGPYLKIPFGIAIKFNVKIICDALLYLNKYLNGLKLCARVKFPKKITLIQDFNKSIKDETERI